MKRKVICKAIIALAVALAFVMPGAAAFANVEQTMNKNISSSEVDVISDVIPGDSIDLHLLTLDNAKSYVNSDNVEKILENSDVDWWPMFHHDIENTGHSSSTAPDTNNVLWEYGTGGTVASAPAVVDGKVFFGSIDEKVYCLDELTGAWIWEYSTGDTVWSSPAVVDGKVFIGSGEMASGASNVYCLDALTGAWIWNYTASGGVDSSPVVAEGKVFFGSHDGNVYCVDALTGAWIWQYTTGGGVFSSPAVADGMVYFGSKDFNLYCLNASTGAWIWNYPAGSPMGVMSSPAVVEGKVFFGASNIPFGTVYCLNALTGAFIWQYMTMGTMVQSSPAVADGKVFVGAFNGNLYCLNALTGAIIWQYATGSAIIPSPAVADGKVYFGSDTNNVYCLDTDGTWIWQHLTAGTVRSSPAVADGKVFIGSSDNFIYCFGPEPSTTIYVDDDADPSWYDATHVKTIAEGITNATAGYTVYVYNGTYRERVIVDKQLDLIGESRENVIVDGYGSGYPFKVTVNDVSIDTFTIMNGSYAIYLYKPSNTVVINCDVYNNTNYAIYASQSSNNIITNCNAYNNKRGIYLTGSSDNIIANCNVYNNSLYGFYITTSSNSNITNCDVYNNIEYGLYIYKSSGCELRDNTIHNNVYNFAVEGTSVSDFNQDIDISNMVDGKPIYYLIDQENITLDENNNFGYLGLISCTNITAKNSDVSGIIMIDTTDSTISNVDSHNSRNGIYLYLSSDNNNIINCDAYNNKYNGGIYIRESSNNNITNCNMYNNIKYGIYIYKSPGNNIINCDVYDNNNYGIYIQYSASSNNVIMNCNVYNNTKVGIRDYSGSNNNIIINCDVYDNSDTGIYLKSSNSNITNCNAYNNNKNGIYVTSASENVVIMNCTSYNNSKDGIYLKSLNSKIINCTAYNNAENGIRIYKYKSTGDNNNIINCDAYNNNDYGIYIYKSSGNSITNCDAYGNNDYGFYLYQSSNNNLEGNAIHDNVYNFAVEGTSVSQFDHVINPSNTVNGKSIYYFVNQENITLDETHNFGYLGLISCTNITAKNSDVSGIIIIDTTDSTISNVDSSNSAHGIYLWKSSDNNILNCSVYNNKNHGIYVYQSPDPNNNNIIDCDAYNNNEGIFISYSSNSNITNCNAYDNAKDGIYIYRSSNNNITDCNTYNNTEIGIYLYEVLNSNVINCNTYNNFEHGIDLSQSSNNNNIINCNIYNNNEYGIRFWVAINIKLRDNTIYDNTYNFGIEYGANVDYFYHDINPSNTINGKPMYYLIKQSDLTLDETNNFGYLALISCTNITAKNGEVNGVLVVNTTDSTISNVDSSNSAYGIYIWLASNNNNIIDCDAYDNSNSGIYIYKSSSNNIENCNLYDNRYGIALNNAANNITNCNSYNNVYGMYLSSSSNSNITNCNLYSNTKNGIRFYISPNNDIINSTIYNNGEDGIYLASISNDNLIHHNNFINNVQNAYDSCSNTWDDGSEGNYWDDYTGVDVDPEDGIGDTPYNITGGSNQDRYPLMLPLDELPPVITDIQATPDLQNTTEPVNITCTVTDNLGMVDTVKVNISGPDGFALEATMNEGSYYYEDVYTTMGDYYYFIWAKDTNGNIATSDTYSFVITEFDKPISSVDLLPTWETAVPFTVTATAYDNTGVENVTLWYRYSTNGTDWTDWASYGTDEETPWSWSFTGVDGYYEFYSIAIDDCANVEDPPDPLVADASTGIDTENPVTTHTLSGTMGGDDWYVSDVTVTLSAIDNLSGVDSTWYQIDSGYLTFYTVPFTVSDEGEHTVYYYSFDDAGNQEDTKSVDFKIDKTSPVTTHEFEGIIGEDGWFVSNVTVTLTAEDSIPFVLRTPMDEEISGVNRTMYKLNNGGWETYVDPFIVTENGDYTLYYYSVDYAGNEEDVNEVDFKIEHDTEPPVTTHEFVGVEGEDGWFISDVTVILTAVDDSAGVDYTMYKLDDNEWEIYYEAFVVTEDGQHTITYYSVDRVGNRENDKGPFDFKIDQTAPTIELTVEKTGLMKWLLTATVSDETSGVAKVEFYLDGVLLGTVTEAPYEWEVTEKGTARAIVFDNAGNEALSDPVPVSYSQSHSRSSSNLVPVQRRISLILSGLTGIQNV